MRRALPRKTDLATLDPQTLDDYAAAYNNTPRKCLGFKTPAEAFSTNCCTSNVNPSPRLCRDDNPFEWSNLDWGYSKSF